MDIIKIDNGKTRLISDGGCGFLEIDNTYYAFLASCNRMYYGVKCDVRFTKDRVIVTSRNRDLTKVSGKKIHVSTSMYQDIKQITKDSNNFIPSLLDFIKLCEKYQKHIFIELHNPMGHKEFKQLINEVNKCKNISLVKIITNDLKFIKAIRKENLEINLELRVQEFSDQVFLDAIKYHFDIGLMGNKINKDLVDLCHENRLRISTFNINDPITAFLLIEQGVDYIYTSFLEEYRPN